MLCFNFEPSMIEYIEKGEENEMPLDEGALRAKIDELDRKIAFYEADIERSDEQSVELLADVATLADRLKELKMGIMEIHRKEPKLQRFLDKMQDETSKRTDELAEAIKSVQYAQKLAATPEKAAQNTRLKELKETIEARKKIMLEVGYGNDDDKRLEEKLEMARARYAELKAKVAEKEKEQSEMEPERGADDSAKGRRKKPKKAPKKGRKQSKRSSSRRRKSSRK